MTQARRLRLRAEVAGCPLVFVTDKADAGPLSDGRTAVAGLMLEGLALEADLDPIRQELDIRPLQLRVLADRAGTKLQQLLRLPSVETYITQDASETDVTIYVEDNAGFATGSFAHIGAETVKIVGVGTDALGDYLDVGRAQWGTKAAAYYAPTADYPSRSVAVSDLPQAYTGRRVDIYVWDGSAWQLEWHGVANGGWSFDGSFFSLTVDGVTTALEASAAPDRDETARAAAVNLPWAPLSYADGTVESTAPDGHFPIQAAADVFAGTWWRLRIGGSGGAEYDVRVYGSFTDHAAYASALESALNAAHGLTDHTFKVTAEEDGSLSIVWVIDAAATTPTYAEIGTPLTAVWMPLFDGPIQVTTVAAGKSYRIHPLTSSGLQFHKAGFLGTVHLAFRLEPDGSTDYASIPVIDGETDRVKLGSPVPSGDFAVRYKGPAYLIKRGRTYDWAYAEVVENADILLQCVYSAPNTFALTGAGVLTHNLETDTTCDVYLVDGFLRPGLQGSFQLTSYVAGDYLGSQIQNLTALAPRGSSLGSTPAIYSEDFANLASDAAMLDAKDAASPLFQHKRVAVIESGTTVAEWLSNALTARGLWLGLDAEGRLRFLDDVPLTETAPTSEVLDASKVTIDEDWPLVEVDPFGRFTRVDWADDYDLVQRDFRLRMTVVDYRATATALRERAIKVELRSTPYTRSRWTDYEWRAAIIDVAHALLSRWAYPYFVVELVTGWSVRLGIGDVVQLNIPKLPDPEDGTLGGVRMGRVIGFRRDLDRASNRYRILVRGRRLYGYTPSARVTAATLVSGTTYDLTCVDTASSGKPLYTGYTLDKLFPAGAKVRVVTVGSATAYDGTVVSAPAAPTGTVRVTFASAPTLLGELYLVYDVARAITEAQEPWLYWAPAGGSIPFASGATPARRYSP